MIPVEEHPAGQPSERMGDGGGLIKVFGKMGRGALVYHLNQGSFVIVMPLTLSTFAIDVLCMRLW